ncbi:MAG TPA: SDR family NAD(P)-dependent oxidoreductase [Gemmataceae bacterium]|nr:SDR family NAD(P)-dependent oxidoreductase [Gemmataceae bacterium]
MAAQGAAVVNYASSQAAADKVVADIRAAGGKAVALQGDVAKAADVKRLFAEAVRAFGRLNVFVNNASVYRFGPIEGVTESEFHRHYDTNVLGPILAIEVLTRTTVRRVEGRSGESVRLHTAGGVLGGTHLLVAGGAPRTPRASGWRTPGSRRTGGGT